MQMTEMFSPHNQNTIQRLGLALCLIAIVAIVLLHNPFSGYRTTESTSTFETSYHSQCGDDEIAQYKKLLLADNLPFAEWKNWSLELPQGFESWSMSKQTDFIIDLKKRKAALQEKCVTVARKSNDVSLPISQWSSNGPVIYWLGSVTNLLLSITFCVLVAAIWVFVFHDRNAAR